MQAQSLHLHGSGQLVASARYIEQVRRIAPEKLLGRERELAALAEFATGGGQSGQYLSWRADAWAGKSALMSSFVLNPPDGTRIVSFFVTARWPNQSDRSAFIENLLRQLAEILQASMPVLTESTREVEMLGMLRDAAEACQKAGEHLVLVVDGLDEDTGLTTGANAYSIAGLLPTDPPAGMRIIVTARPHPPLPSDVDDSHPLRDPEIVRTLVASSAAAAIRTSMDRELRSLWDNVAGRDLLGLLTAAGGGLTAIDLASITDVDAREISDLLGSAAGRSFQTIGSQWHVPADYRYVFGHEGLPDTAAELLGPTKLMAYRQRVHDWVSGYRSGGWPEDTPEYLVGGYFRLLKDTGDVAGMIQHSTDAVLHDRMLAISGLDDLALSAIRVTMDTLLDAAEPDVLTLARLAVHRDRLHDRNTNMPVQLPAVWAILGDARRADALVGLILDPKRRFDAVLELLAACPVDDTEHARALASDALNVVTATNVTGRAKRWSALVTKATSAGLTEWVAAAVQAIEEPADRWAAWRAFMLGLASSGRIDVAKTTAEAIALGEDRWAAFAALATAAVEYGDFDRAESLLRQAQVDTEAPAESADIVTAVRARVLAATGHAMDALELAESATNDKARADILADLVPVIAHNYPGVVLRVTASIDQRDQQIRAIGDLLAVLPQNTVDTVLQRLNQRLGDWAPSLVRLSDATGDADRVRALLDEADRHANERSDDAFVRDLAQAAVEAGEVAWAERYVRRVSAPDQMADNLASLAMVILRRGETDRARDLAIAAEVAAQRNSPQNNQVPDEALEALVAAGEADRAVMIAASAAAPDAGTPPIAVVAKAMASNGDYDHAHTVAMRIEKTAARDELLLTIVKTMKHAERLDLFLNSITDPKCRHDALMARATILIADGRRDEAEVIIRAHADPHSNAWKEAVLQLARSSARSNDLQRVLELLNWIRTVRESWDIPLSLTSEISEWIARILACAGAVDSAVAELDTISRRQPRIFARVGVGQELADSDHVEQARAIARSLSEPSWRSSIDSRVVGALLRRNDFAQAELTAKSIEEEHRRVSALADLALAMSRAGNLHHADELFRSINHPHRDPFTRMIVVLTASATGDVEKVRSAARHALPMLGRGLLDNSVIDKIVNSLLTVDEPERMAEFCQSIRDIHVRGQAWLAWARHDPSPYRHAQALLLCPWTTPLTVLAKTRPDVVLAAVDEFVSLSSIKSPSSCIASGTPATTR